MTTPVQPATHCLFTIGHSHHPLAHFLSLLLRHEITAVADVRSMPYSHFAPHFNREPLAEALKAEGIKYVFMGRELGARRGETEAYCDGRVKYDLVCALPAFNDGLQRLRRGALSQRIALMCTEKDPIDCHRTILVCRSLRPWVRALHILADGSLESGQAAENRLLDILGLPEQDLFRSRQELIEAAYDIQGERIAYIEEGAAERERAS